MSDKIEACACGSSPVANVIRTVLGGYPYVSSVTCKACGWRKDGHRGDNKDETLALAISAWNEVMRAVRMQREYDENRPMPNSPMD